MYSSSSSEVQVVEDSNDELKARTKEEEEEEEEEQEEHGKAKEEDRKAEKEDKKEIKMNGKGRLAIPVESRPRVGNKVIPTSVAAATTGTSSVSVAPSLDLQQQNAFPTTDWSGVQFGGTFDSIGVVSGSTNLFLATNKQEASALSGFSVPATSSIGPVAAATTSFGSTLTNKQEASALTGFSVPATSSTGPFAAATTSFGSTLFKTTQAKIGLWKQMEISAADVQRSMRLGQGAYAEVYRGRARGMECAIKMYRVTASAKQKGEAMREIRLGASLDHPNTLRLLGWVRKPLQTITELCCGDLKAFYENKIEVLQYDELQAVRLLKVGKTRVL